ncbi:MAG: hypothetical protein U5K56_13100 [Halioglobus sp.]|nr:hypothetical protein [Halioglobus sp.]
MVAWRTKLTGVMLFWLGLSALPAAADSCDFLEDSRQPKWVTQGSADRNTVAAVGASTGSNTEAQNMMRESLLSARTALAEALVSQVTSETTLEQRKDARGAEEVFRSVSLLESNVALRGVAPKERWLDRDNCILYTLVELDREEAEILASDALLTDLVAQAQDDANSHEDRYAYYRQAERVAEFARQLGASDSQLSAYPELASLGTRLARAERVRGETEQRILQLRTLLDAPGRGTQRKGYRQLLNLVNSARFDPAIDTGAEPLYEFAARTEQARGNYCSARSYASRLQRFTHFDYWRQRADDLLRQLGATGEDCPLQMADLLGGLEVTLVCQYRTGSAVRQWRKMCSTLGESLRDIQSAATVLNPSQGQFDTLLGGGCPAGINGAALLALADGEMERRSGQAGAAGDEYRFVGDIAVRVIDQCDPLFDDTFTATTGWNPLSGAIVMDILAINVGKRFRQQLSR